MNKFAWGKVIDKFDYDFDGVSMTVTKYHPWKTNGSRVIKGDANENEIEYHCKEIHRSSVSLYALVLSWMAYKQLGLNQDALVVGICKAMEIKTDA